MDHDFSLFSDPIIGLRDAPVKGASHNTPLRSRGMIARNGCFIGETLHLPMSEDV
jgi:hypothetical protein